MKIYILKNNKEILRSNIVFVWPRSIKTALHMTPYNLSVASSQKHYFIRSPYAYEDEVCTIITERVKDEDGNS